MVGKDVIIARLLQQNKQLSQQVQLLIEENRRLREKIARLEEKRYFLFLEHDGVSPTNNATEQAIRFVVIDRQVTQGTRSWAGMRWCERAWTVVATCARHNRSVYQFLVDAVTATYTNTPYPKLIPAKL